MHTNCKYISEELAEKLVRCVEDAVGDGIREDIQKNDLQTKNSVPARIWDLMNTNIIKTLETQDCTIAKAHRGPWEMLIVFEKTTQCIFTLMREKRFTEIRKYQRKRVHMHYVDMLAKQFNNELIAEQKQLSLFPHAFADEERLAELVQILLSDLKGDIEVVRNHVLILFDTEGYQLKHIRAIMVTPDLEIAAGSEQDWSAYISTHESVIVEKVANPDAAENRPNRGLSLKAKAVARQKNKPKRKDLEQDIIKDK